uniref:protochlorophyllide reductase subunit B n=1 Tax=Trentepohlia sp. BN17 TaxID=3063876 RepID=UPI001EDEFBFF|nr:protochlorophyllide reductase subunit B [Trentepohlia sp. BN17]UIB38725.1 protochlorophyllide reductase subunit B [Trentepohlia sp. BN17]
MKLAYWMYAGPAHIGTLYDYFNVMRSMLERERDFTPVTTSVVDRHVLARGSQEKVFENITRKDKESQPDLIILTPTCTSSILQEDLQNFVNRASLEAKSADVLLADVNHYRVNELQAADRTLEQIVRYYIEKYGSDTEKTKKPSVNIIGVFTLGFHNAHDCRELKRILYDLNIDVNLIIPEGNSVLKDLKNLPKAWFNLVPYREVGLMTAKYLESLFGMPYVSTTPMGILETANCIREMTSIIRKIYHQKHEVNSNTPDEQTKNVSEKSGQNETTHREQNIFHGSLSHRAEPGGEPQKDNDKLNYDLSPFDKTSTEKYIDQQTRFVSQAAWFSRSIDCQNLTGKKAIVFGDATHAAYMTKILVREMGIRVACAGTYCKHDADWFREQTAGYCDSILITESHNEVANAITEISPSAVFKASTFVGTQMERHIGKRVLFSYFLNGYLSHSGIPCAVISAPVHIQNFTLSFRPFLGFEGTNQIADLVYNSFSLGIDKIVLFNKKYIYNIFFPFFSRPFRLFYYNNNWESHLLEIFSGHDTKEISSQKTTSSDIWSAEATAELTKVPGPFRGKVKKMVEKYAKENNISSIKVDTMYAAREAA